MKTGKFVLRTILAFGYSLVQNETEKARIGSAGSRFGNEYL